MACEALGKAVSFMLFSMLEPSDRTEKRNPQNDARGGHAMSGVYRYGDDDEENDDDDGGEWW